MARRRHHRRVRHHRRSHLRANKTIKSDKNMIYIGLAVVGGVAAWYFLSGSKKQPGAYAPGTGEIVYQPQPPIPAAQGTSVPSVPEPPSQAMPDWMKAAIAAGALIPGALPGTLVINAAYDWWRSDTPWWQKAAMVAGALTPGVLPGTLVLNAAYDWWKSL